MNLNDRIMNPANKTKSKNTFVITARAEEQQEHSSSSKSFIKKSTKKSSTVHSSGTKWGGECVSVLNSSSARSKTSSSKVTDENQLKVIVALTEGTGQARCEVGMAVVSIPSNHLIICQLSDSQNYMNTLTKINIFNPSEILFPSTFGGNRLINKVKEQFPNIRYTGVARSVFNKLSGYEMLFQLCIPSLNGVLLVLKHRYYALAAASAVLTYIQDTLYIYYAGGSLNIQYQESEGYAVIDVSTADRLELVCSAKPEQANKFSSLLGILNYCVTKIGTRKLRSWILQPPSKVAYIEERLNCVEELIKNRESLSSIQITLQKFSSVDSLLNLATIIPTNPQQCSIRQLNYMINLNSIIESLSPLKTLVSYLKGPFFVKLRNTLNDSAFTQIKDMVKEVINDYVQPIKGQTVIQQRCFAIKPGNNELLDVVRKIFSERINDMKEYVETLSEKYNLALALGNNQKKGYHIVLNLDKSQRRSMKKSDLPDEFIEIYRSSTFFTMKTPELMNISTRVEDIMEDVLKISNVIVHSMVLSMKKHMHLFHTLCEEIAQLDVYQSLAQTSLENNYIRPEFGEYTEVRLGQHPLLNFLLPTKPCPNTVLCSDNYNVHIITGPNGAGKSIYIRQVMLLQIMAQLGCYVPAQSAIFKTADMMFARIYMEDDMEYNASSFVLEMREIKYIMSTMANNSLIIIDELGRSTALEEGMSVAIAVLEQMACFSSYIYVTTHFTTLANLHLIYPNIKTWQMETIPSGDDPRTFKLDYKYSLISGITNIGRYGVYIVRNIWPDSIVRNIDNCLDILEKQPRKSIFTPLDKTCLLKYNVESEFRHLKKLKLLSVSKIKQLVLQYQADLKTFGYHLTTFAPSNQHVLRTTGQDLQNDDLEEYESMNSQDYLLRKQTSEQILSPMYVTEYIKPNDNFFTPNQSTCEYDERSDQFLTPNQSEYEYVKSNEVFFTPNRSMSEFVEPAEQMFRPNVSKQVKPIGMFNFQQPPTGYTPPSTYSYTESCNDPDFLRILSPVVIIDEYEENNVLSQQQASPLSQDRTHLSSLVSPEEYRSICEELEQQFCETEDSELKTSQCEDYVDNNSHIEVESELTVVNNNFVMSERNTYKYYVSPVVTVVEGLNNTSRSFGEEDDAERNNRVKIISNVLIQEQNVFNLGAMSVETSLYKDGNNGDGIEEEKQRRSITNDGNDPTVVEQTKSYNEDFNNGITRFPSDAIIGEVGNTENNYSCNTGNLYSNYGKSVKDHEEYLGTSVINDNMCEKQNEDTAPTAFTSNYTSHNVKEEKCTDIEDVSKKNVGKHQPSTYATKIEQRKEVPKDFAAKMKVDKKGTFGKKQHALSSVNVRNARRNDTLPQKYCSEINKPKGKIESCRKSRNPSKKYSSTTLVTNNSEEQFEVKDIFMNPNPTTTSTSKYPIKEVKEEHMAIEELGADLSKKNVDKNEYSTKHQPLTAATKIEERKEVSKDSKSTAKVVKKGPFVKEKHTLPSANVRKVRRNNTLTGKDFSKIKRAKRKIESSTKTCTTLITNNSEVTDIIMNPNPTTTSSSLNVTSDLTSKKPEDESSGYNTKTEEFLTAPQIQFEHIDIDNHTKSQFITPGGIKKDDKTSKELENPQYLDPGPSTSNSSMHISAAANYKNLDRPSSVFSTEEVYTESKISPENQTDSKIVDDANQDISKHYFELAEEDTVANVTKGKTPSPGSSASTSSVNVSSASRNRNLDDATGSSTPDCISVQSKTSTTSTKHNDLSNISSASRKRNLDVAPSKSRPASATPTYELNGTNLLSSEPHNLTNISSASRKRNLDVTSSRSRPESATPTYNKLNKFNLLSSDNSPEPNNLTNISSASRKRNLDGTSSRSRPESATPTYKKLNTIHLMSSDNSPQPNNLTNIPSASRIRNLDGTSSRSRPESATPTYNKLNTINVMSSDNSPEPNNLTNISSALRNRNLDGTSSRSRPESATPTYNKLNTINVMSSDNSPEPNNLTNISSASRNRNLDGTSSRSRPESATPTYNKLNTINVMSSDNSPEPTNLTNISSASRKRNLDGTSSRSRSATPTYKKLNTINVMPSDNSPEPTNLTNISSASRKRNLDGTSSRSRSATPTYKKLNTINVMPSDNSPEPTNLTNISSASRKRNLDGTSSRSRSATPTYKKLNTINVMSSDNSPEPTNLTNISSASRKRNLDGTSSRPRSATPTYNKLNTINLMSSDNSPEPTHLANISSASRKRNLDDTSSRSPSKTSTSHELNVGNLLSSGVSPKPKINLFKGSKKIRPVFRVSSHRKLTSSSEKFKLSAPKHGQSTKVINSSSSDISDHRVDNEADNKSVGQMTVPSASKKVDALPTNDSRWSTRGQKEDGTSCNPSDTGNCMGININTEVPTNFYKNSNRSRVLKQRFVPPRKLSAKKIREEFDEQDRNILNNPNEFNVTKYLEQRLNRPSVRQIQDATHLGTLRKTARGFQVISTEIENSRPKRTIMKTFSNDSIDMTIFSDKNAKTFEEFINSRETDLQKFSFNKPGAEEKATLSFKTNTENIFEYYLENSQNKPCSQKIFDFSLTPNGYYKQNKEAINAVMSKYLDNASSSGAQSSQRAWDLQCNIFGNSNLSNEDLDL